MINLVVDGDIYGRQRFGGINAMFNAVLPLLASRHNAKVTLQLPKQVKGELPGGRVRYIARDVFGERSGISWKLDSWLLSPLARTANAVVRNAHIGIRRNTVFQSTYFTWTECNVPQVAVVYDMNHELFSDLFKDEWGIWLRKQYREYITRATRVIAISSKTKNDLVNIYDVDPADVDVVHLAVDTTRFYPCEEKNLSDLLEFRDWLGRYILYVGERGGYKNFACVLKALEQIPSELCPGLVAAGRAWSREERQMIASLCLEDRVHLVCEPTPDQLRRLYSGGLAFVYPSLHEGFGIPLLEAMACRTPVVAADTQVFREVAADAAVYFDPDEPTQLRNAIGRLVEDNHHDSMVERGSARLSYFSWERCAAGMHEAYTRALAEWN